MKVLGYMYIRYICLHLWVYLCMFIYIYILYAQTVYKYKAFVHPNRKGGAAQVSVSYYIADKPGGVLSDAAILTAQGKQM